ncbi:putative damage-inducible protein DinB [Rhodoligotrophos appendicifer]|uniref:DinB family protein n=1 Tax=Rhodoligotrophos appendicifer TaxID=987056 RepID=UPI00117F375F|nr:DinB family protein [Rhodoligotrophos appendicifer]
MKSHFEMLSAYNKWANRRLYDAAERLSDSDYRSDRGAFFGSLHGTLNHLLVGDRIWMQRFTGGGQAPARLDLILCESLPELRVAREAEDERIETFIAGLTPDRLAGTIVYRSTRSPVELEQHFAPLLTHFFNHQTHHRGQAHCIVTGLTGEAPSLDLLVFQRETGLGMVRGHGGAFNVPERRPATGPR